MKIYVFTHRSDFNWIAIIKAENGDQAVEMLAQSLYKQDKKDVDCGDLGKADARSLTMARQEAKTKWKSISNFNPEKMTKPIWIYL